MLDLKRRDFQNRLAKKFVEVWNKLVPAVLVVKKTVPSGETRARNDSSSFSNDERHRFFMQWMTWDDGYRLALQTGGGGFEYGQFKRT